MQRLKTRSQFQAALAGGTVARTHHFALHRMLLSPALFVDAATDADTSAAKSSSLFAVRSVWMGAMVPKRWAKRAVTRNAIKRRIYSVSTEFEALMPMAAHVVRLRVGFDRVEFVSATSEALITAVSQELRQLFTRASVKLSLPGSDGKAGK